MYRYHVEAVTGQHIYRHCTGAFTAVYGFVGNAEVNILERDNCRLSLLYQKSEWPVRSVDGIACN